MRTAVEVEWPTGRRKRRRGRKRTKPLTTRPPGQHGGRRVAVESSRNLSPPILRVEPEQYDLGAGAWLPQGRTARQVSGRVPDRPTLDDIERSMR